MLIRRGTGIGYSVYHMHRLKSIYGPDACEFRPERWEGNTLSKVGWGFMPFHGGPRICLGSKLYSVPILFLRCLIYRRGFCSHRSFLCNCTHHSGFSKHNVTARDSSATDRSGKAITYDRSHKCRRVQGAAQIEHVIQMQKKHLFFQREDSRCEEKVGISEKMV